MATTTARRARPPTLIFVIVLLAAFTGCAGGQDGASTQAPVSRSAHGAGARPAEAFVESIGVNTHSFYRDTPYENFELIERRLHQLGIHHIRENLAAEEPEQYRHLNQLAEGGIHATLIMGGPENGLAGLEELIAIVADQLNGDVDAVEGPNELDLNAGSNWPELLTEYQRALYEDVKGDPSTSSIPVIGPSLGWLKHASAAPDLSRYLDYGNIHSYPGGQPPEPELEAWLAGARFMSGNKPVMATETGYHTAVNSFGEHPPVSEAAEAVYMPRLYLDYFAHGVVRTFAYELADEHPDPGLEEPESNFGLLRNDLSPKPAFTAIANLIEILEDPGNADFHPGKLNYATSGDLRDLHQVLLAKRDGSFDLALWREGSVWDTESHTPLQPGSAPVELHFGAGVRSATEYLPNLSAQPTADLTVDAGATSVRVGARVVILQVRPN